MERRWAGNSHPAQMKAVFKFMAGEHIGRVESPGAGITSPAHFSPPAKAKTPASQSLQLKDDTAKFLHSLLIRPERWGINE
ncbi:MAG: hypothetical protein RL616_508 [Verrucomicrobiota bacterium]